MNLTGAQLDSCISSDSSCAEIPVKFLGHPSYEVSCLFLCLKSENKLTSKKKCGWYMLDHVGIHLLDLTWQIRKQLLSIRKFFR